MEKRLMKKPQGTPVGVEVLREDIPLKTDCGWLSEVPEREDDLICISNMINRDEK